MRPLPQKGCKEAMLQDSETEQTGQSMHSNMEQSKLGTDQQHTKTK